MNESAEPIDAFHSESEQAGAAPVTVRGPEQSRPAPARTFRAMHALPEAAGTTPASTDYALF